ncbi:MAG: GumC family protein [Terriglobia bacterium]
MMDQDEPKFLERRRSDRMREYLADNVNSADAGPFSTPALANSYREILYRRRWHIITSVLIVATIVAVYTLKTKPVYRATGRVEIEAETPQIQSLNSLYPSLPTSDESYLKTQVEVLESNTLAWQTIEQLDLARRPGFAPGERSGNAQAHDPAAAEGLLLARFRQRLSVQLMPESRLVEVSFESTEPALAAEVVNALLQNYVQYNFYEKYDATRQASGWLQKQLDELKANVEKSQEALVNYERKNAIVNVNNRQDVSEQRLEALSKDLTDAQSDLAQKQSLYELTKSNQNEAALIVQDTLLDRLQENSADLKEQYLAALKQTGPNFPKVVRLRDQVSEIQSLVGAERGRILARIKSDYLASSGREQLLAGSVAQQKAEVGRIDQLLIQHNLLQREFQSNQQLYDSLLQRLKDATVSAGLRATNIHIVDQALVPSIPIRPKKFHDILAGVLVGLLVGFLLALLQESLDSSVKTAEEAERVAGMACLATIPLADPELRQKQPWLWGRRGRGPVRDSIATTVMNAPASHLAESYRTLRTAILFSTPAHPPQVILVTSAQPNEGKTCTSVNLSGALAQRGKRVLLIDSDLRNPGVARALGLPSDAGLSGILTGAHSLDRALQRVEQTPGLWVLPAGPHAPNPAELISSPGMEELLKEARERFDHVVLDSPPVLGVTDATILSLFADGTVLVAESAVTARRTLMRAQRMLSLAGSKILGLVLNKVDYHRDLYYYNFSYPSRENSGSRNGGSHSNGSHAIPSATSRPS